jgi:2-dehydro-3-deoxygluconokinase
MFNEYKEYIKAGRKVVAFGDIILELTPPMYQRIIQADVFEVTFAGAESDFAIDLALLGVPVDFVTRLPNNVLGDKCINYLRQFGVGVHKILRGGDRIGIFFVEKGAGPRPSIVLYDKDNSAFATLKPGDIDWDYVFKDAFWFHFSGITPATSQSVAEVCLEALKKARKLGLTVSCDLNYRAQLWRWCKNPGEVMSELIKYVDIVISNEEEVEKYFGIKAPGVDVYQGKINVDSYKNVAEELLRLFPNLKLIAFTLRTSISASYNLWEGALYDGRKFYKSRRYEIFPIIDRIGAGDSFAAALVYGLIYMSDLQQALEFAVAASCLKHTIPGPVNIVNDKDIINILEKGTSGRIIR